MYAGTCVYVFVYVYMWSFFFRNRHLTKADLERKFKEHIVYERRPEDKQKVRSFFISWFSLRTT